MTRLWAKEHMCIPVLSAANCSWRKSLFLSKLPFLFGGREGIEPQRKPMFLLLLGFNMFISWDSWRLTDTHRNTYVYTHLHILHTGANIYRGI